MIAIGGERMFNILKTTLESKKLEKLGSELKKNITESSIEKLWFCNSFSSENGLWDYKTCKDYKSYVYLISSQIRDAIIKYYLLDNGYLSKLVIKRKQLICNDEYGDLVVEDWLKEVKKFTVKRREKIHDYLINETPQVLVDALIETKNWGYYTYSEDFLVDEIWDTVEDVVAFADCDEMYDDESETITDPYEYERFIARKLCELGWDAYSTTGSGDQGADVVAEKFGIKFVIQCKLYGKPVGNKAVQEVSSARDYYDADGSAVVTNQGYTKSARQLAESQSVWLLHDSELEAFSHSIDNMITSDS